MTKQQTLIQQASREQAPGKKKGTSSQDYHKIKAKAKEAERTNFDKLILIPCSGNGEWYELAEHSAVFYYHKVCLQLGVEVAFYADTDSYVVQYEIGYIRCHGLDAVRSRLKKINLYKDEYTQNGCFIFSLATHFTKAETEKLVQAELARRAKNQSIVKITHSDPLLHQTLRELSEKLHRACETQLTRLSANTNGARMLGLIDTTLVYYYGLCSARTPSISAGEWECLGKNINSLLIELELASEAKLLPRKTCVHLVGIASKTKEYITRKYAIARTRERRTSTEQNVVSSNTNNISAAESTKAAKATTESTTKTTTEPKHGAR